MHPSHVFIYLGVMMNYSVWKLLGIVILGFLAAGCGSGPRLYKAVGTVTYKGQPVEGATVNFNYDNGNSAVGSTDATGKFQLFSLSASGGAAAGKGVMTVTKISGGSVPAPMLTSPNKGDLKNTSPAELKKQMAELRTKTQGAPGQGTSAPPKNELPAKYADVTTSGLSFEILPKNNNDFTVVLKD
ncbi:MAG: carboxypeptidase-like regulatory domain-containing protein [Planctomycetales bacterium]|nr:carboxypeptidase-like regulatory domain-containing protein [Planctomycetales bacterium]